MSNPGEVLNQELEVGAAFRVFSVWLSEAQKLPVFSTFFSLTTHLHKLSGLDLTVFKPTGLSHQLTLNSLTVGRNSPN